jgi:DNA-binding MarR family transcriptional regulator
VGPTKTPLISHSPNLVRIEQGLGKISYLINRVRRHELIRRSSGVPVDRAAAVILRRLEESEPLRPSELAARLEVEAPHVTRQVQRLEDQGYITRIADAGDRRAQLIGLTPSGRNAAARIREASRSALAGALESWSEDELHDLADLLSRMADDYLAYADQEIRRTPT